MACPYPYYTKYGALVPCGKCPYCLEARGASWVYRLQQQLKVQPIAHFVTLTYSEENLVRTANNYRTLVKSHCQNFMKKLRRDSGIEGLKYYFVGEYGSQRNRPHYHAIIFGVDNVDLFASCWPYGTVFIGDANASTMGYTCGYLQKGRAVPAHANDDRIREFSLMSKGLGSVYLTPEKVQYHIDDISRTFVIADGGRKLPLPRYYRKKIFEENNIDISQLALKYHVEGVKKDKELFLDYKKRFPNGTYDDYWEEKNERRRMAVRNKRLQQIKKQKL